MELGGITLTPAGLAELAAGFIAAGATLGLLVSVLASMVRAADQ